MIKITLDTKAFAEACKKAPIELNKRLRAAFVDIGGILVIEGRERHRWQHRKHNLEQDIGFQPLEEKGNTIGISFGLKDNLHMTRLKKAYGPFVSYGELLHVGFRNWTSDPWLQTAATKNESMIQKELSEAVELTARGF